MKQRCGNCHYARCKFQKKEILCDWGMTHLTPDSLRCVAIVPMDKNFGVSCPCFIPHKRRVKK
jgi:hypothetical protein